MGSSLPGQVDRYEIAERLSDLFPTAKIIVVIRNQFDIIKSAYLQKLKFEMDYIPFSEWLEAKRARLHLTSFLHYFDYLTLFRLYSNLFDGRVRIFIYEDFRKNYDLFIRDLCRYLGINEEKALRVYDNRTRNVRWSRSYFALNRMLNNYPLLSGISSIIPSRLKANLKSLIRVGRPVEIDYSEEEKSFIKDFYKDSNTALSQRLGLDLETYGYPVRTIG
jgi:hypothetical protein